MSPPPEPSLLNYRPPPASLPAWPWLVLALGLIPLTVIVVAMYCEESTGDPPNNLREFQAYHYAVGLAMIAGLTWVAGVARAFRDRRRPWVVPVAWLWCAWVWWWGGQFLKCLNDHPAAEFYWYLWRQ